MGTKVKELNANLHKLQPYKPIDMTGRVRYDTVWERALDRWKPGLKVTVTFDI